ncbi:putative monovalent cation/H+ antiporter subunit A [Sphingobacterium spiritivorum]|uniref:putative monovalent cation/H+ antiporter subunit A n=1 Tax=Sphingobacterium spiritivorum TaxID=258 RepID=UPI003DA33CE8
MLFAVLSGLITSSLIVPFGKFLKSKWGFILAFLPCILFLYFLQYTAAIVDGNIIQQHISWVPSLGVDFQFRLDGLSLLFTFLITGIGTAIFLYARSYLKGYPNFDRFFGFLCLFMAAMLGVVLSDNIFLLFIFWELTSISSFFLIGFNNEQSDSRKSALTALSITGLGGFFLLAGLTLIGNIADTYTISELVDKRSLIIEHPLYPLILGLIFIGAFTKSAQFPFHFWLPGAMKAPTPVSAYLHSATMVKAGIYLLARFFPILGGTEYWTYPLLIIGGITMLYGAIHSLFRVDMKGVLAYSTISALGILTFLLGMGTKEAIIAAAVFLLVHALYKATLFLITGIIDHETGTRDLSKLQGLRKVLFPVAVAGLLASLSSAGMPLTLGFIGKDLIYDATLKFDTQLALFVTIAAVVTNIGLVAAGFMAGIKPFAGKLPDQFKDLHLPYKSMWIPPLVLAVLGLLLGIYPEWIGHILTQQTASSIFGGAVEVHLKLWHGFNTVLILSLLTLALGTILYLINKPSNSKLLKVEKLNVLAPQTLFNRFGNGFVAFSNRYTQTLHNGFLRSYHLKIILFAEALLAYKLYLSGPIYIDYSKLSAISIYEVSIVLILIGALYLVVSTSSRLTAVVSMSVIGYCICLLFVIYSAPDLAMTQFTIDTLSTVLFVLVLYKLPVFMNYMGPKVLIRDAIVALSFGALLSMIALKVLQEPVDTVVSDFYGANAYLMAKGKNVVNVILVDYRGIDTMFETIVLAIAALGVYSLLKLRLKSSEKE